MNQDKKVAIITGASQGIGAALVKAYRDRDYRVVAMAKPFTDYTEDDFAAKISTNLAGFFHITQRAIAEMLKSGHGHVVTITTSLTDHAISGVPHGPRQPDR